MPKICYVEKRFHRSSREMIDMANVILHEYAAKGFDLTLRQLYYQFVARGYLENKQANYNKLGNVVSNARLAGLIDWNHIVDRTRNLKGFSSWNNPAEIIKGSAHAYHLDRWQNQDVRFEVWIEKEALAGIFARVCAKWDIDYFACRGYTSQSEMWRGSLRLTKYARAGQTPIILHFGDHDPSGVDMSRDIQDRTRTFWCDMEFHRLALNMDQVEKFNPPPNPAKLTDSRCQGYILKYGDKSWELDALDPETLEALVEKAIEQHRDPDKWQEIEDREEEEKSILLTLADNWEEIKEHMEENYV